MDDKSSQNTLNFSNNIVPRNNEKKAKHVELPVTLETRDDCSFANFLDDINYNTIKDFSLSSKKLTNLPEDFGLRFVNLTRLDLSRNKLINIPHSLKSLIKLEQLVLNYNSIRYLPVTITEMSQLTLLGLSNNCLTALPDSVANLRSLETLDLSYNLITELPVSCKNMNRLRVLDLSGNCLKFVPCCIVAGMNNLETLDLSYNLYINLSSKPASKVLKNLYVRDARCNVKFPLWILTGEAPSLEILDLDGTCFVPFEFPEKSSNLGIKILSLRRCCIYDAFLQKILSLASELVSLRAGNDDFNTNGNCFWKMHIENLRSPKKVEKIDLRSTGLPSVCPSIKKFINLVKLDIGRNTLNWLPAEICCLKKLEILIVDDNLLSSLPVDIGGMTLLRELRAAKNNLSRLPDSLRQLKNLAYLDLYHNEFRDIPKILEFVERLVGLDIDHNFDDFNNRQIGETEYGVMRESLRNRYPSIGSSRETGPRYETEIEEQTDTSSENSSIDCYEWSAEIIETENEKMEEDWDISEDSAEEYDPNCDSGVSTRKTVRNFSYAMAISRSCLYCPGDLHPPPMKQQIARLREKGLFPKYPDTVIEGQFDDA